MLQLAILPEVQPLKSITVNTDSLEKKNLKRWVTDGIAVIKKVKAVILIALSVQNF